MYYSTHYQSPIGDILIASDENSIIGIWIDGSTYVINKNGEVIKGPFDANVKFE